MTLKSIDGYTVASQNGVFYIFSSKITGKRLLGMTRPRWEDNIRINLKEIEVNVRSSAQNRGFLESPYECGIEPPSFLSHGVSYTVVTRFKASALESYYWIQHCFDPRLRNFR